jgi:hypothetical protein
VGMAKRERAGALPERDSGAESGSDGKGAG